MLKGVLRAKIGIITLIRCIVERNAMPLNNHDKNVLRHVLELHEVHLLSKEEKIMNMKEQKKPIEYSTFSWDEGSTIL